MSRNKNYKQGLTIADEDSVRNMSNDLLMVLTDYDRKYTAQVCTMVKVQEKLSFLLNNLLVRELDG